MHQDKAEADVGDRYLGVLMMILVVSGLTVGRGFPTGVVPLPREPVGVVIAAGRGAMLESPGAAARPLTVGESLRWADVVYTSGGSIVQLRFGRETVVTVRELSRLEVRLDSRPTGAQYVIRQIAASLRRMSDRLLQRTARDRERARAAVASVRG